MRKLLVSDLITLDGFFAGPNGEIDWHVVGEEFNNYAIDLLDSVDTLVFGRVTYEEMASYWPTPMAMANDPTIAEKMNTVAKVVVSTTLEKAEWNNTTLIKDNIAEEISQLKQQPGRDMAIFGSGALVSSLTSASLIDEYCIVVNPLILGKGIPLFKDIAKPVNLRLLRTKTLNTGVIVLYYELAGK